jgi:predicted alpha/beta superfamily hydrolase
VNTSRTALRTGGAILSLCLACAFARAGSVEGHLETVDFASDVFGNTRKLRIWLPDGYFGDGNRARHYPVLYLNDGQDLFDAATSSFGAGEWRLDETATALIAARRIEPVIIVGIDNAGRRARAREYLPYPDHSLSPPEPSPQGRRYAAFLASEVIPYIESRYRARRDRRSRTLGGSSYGALIALYVAVSRPQLFGQLLLESPSFYVDDDHVLVDAAQAGLQLERVYLGVGTNELGLDACADHADNRVAVDGVRRLSAILTDKGLLPGRILVNIEPCAVHSPAAWAGRLPRALQFLYRARPVPAIVDDGRAAQ